MQSSRSVTEITKPKPEDSRSTLETLLRKRFKKPYRNATLAIIGM